MCSARWRTSLPFEGQYHGFRRLHGFTPVQYRLIGILLKLCRNVFVTVSATMEPGMDLTAESDETDSF